MERNNLEISNEDIDSLKSYLDLTNEFFSKLKIVKHRFDYAKFQIKIRDLKKLYSTGEIIKSNKKFYKILARINSYIKKVIRSDIFFIFGGHGGIIIDNIGFCEFDNPKFALNKLINKMKFANECDVAFNIEVAPSCLETLNKKYPDKIKEIVSLFKKGNFDFINPTYSQPYNLIIGAESNIKQFEFGLNSLKNLKIDANIYYASECSVHPQIPQILKYFGIRYSSLRTRLLGMNPGCVTGNVIWEGLDGSLINSMTDQSGIYNGEYWHGMFFNEIPHLLVQSISKPFLNSLFFSCIEDFILDLPNQETIWRLSKYSELFGRFITATEFFNISKPEGTSRFLRDSFYIADDIFKENKLFLNNKKCEQSLLALEALNFILGFFTNKSFEQIIDKLWKELLLTQAHDNYAVPFIRSGDYSKTQLEEVTHNVPLSSSMISEKSEQIQKEILSEIKKLSLEIISLIGKNLKKNSVNQEQILSNFLIINPSSFEVKKLVKIPLKNKNGFELSLINNKDELVEYIIEDNTLQFFAEMTPVSYKVYSLIRKETKADFTPKKNFKFRIEVSKNKQSLQFYLRNQLCFELKFHCSTNYHLMKLTQQANPFEKTIVLIGKKKRDDFRLEISQYKNSKRLEFLLKSKDLEEIEFTPYFKTSEFMINYPFGIEKTTRSKVQILDFLYLRGEFNNLVFIQYNCQRITLDQENFNFKASLNGSGVFEFALYFLDGEIELYDIYNTRNQYFCDLIISHLGNSKEIKNRSKTFLSLNIPLYFTNLWRRESKSYVRIFNPSNKAETTDILCGNLKKVIKELDLLYREIRIYPNDKLDFDPWKFRTFQIRD